MRSDKVRTYVTPHCALPKTPVSLQPPNYEQHTRDIDIAITGDMPALSYEPWKRVIVSGKEITQA